MSSMRTTRTPLVNCPWCGLETEFATNFEGHTPKEGSIIVCSGCSSVSVLTGDMLLRRIRTDDLEGSSIENMELLARYKAAVQVVMLMKEQGEL